MLWEMITNLTEWIASAWPSASAAGLLDCNQYGLDSSLRDNILNRFLCGNELNYGEDASTLAIFEAGGILSRDGGILIMINVIGGALAILFMGIIAARMIFNNGEVEKITEGRKQIQWMIFGLLFISAAEILTFQILDPQVNFLTNREAAVAYQGIMFRVLSLIKYIAGALVLITLLRAGWALAVFGDGDDAQSKGKTFLQSVLLGSIMVVMSEGIILLLSLPEIDASASPEQIQEATTQAARITIKQIGGAIRFVLSFVGVVAVGVLIYAGLLHSTSFGSEESQTRATKLIIGAVLGVIIAISAYGIVNIVLPT